MSQLEIKDLHISIGDKPIVKGLTLTVRQGEVHAIMGPNGTGKSTLAKAIAGHPDYAITSGDVLLDGKSILELEPDERARAGIFLAFQYPSEIPGVTIANFLRAAQQARLAEGEELDATGYYKRLYSKMDMLKIDRKFTSRAVNDGFSGGEKKRCEILQMAMLEPAFALMDETDSGLDIDALRIVENLAAGGSQQVEDSAAKVGGIDAGTAELVDLGGDLVGAAGEVAVGLRREGVAQRAVDGGADQTKDQREHEHGPAQQPPTHARKHRNHSFSM